jgi:hypothetical protein
MAAYEVCFADRIVALEFLKGFKCLSILENSEEVSLSDEPKGKDAELFHPRMACKHDKLDPGKPKRPCQQNSQKRVVKNNP